MSSLDLIALYSVVGVSHLDPIIRTQKINININYTIINYHKIEIIVKIKHHHHTDTASYLTTQHKGEFFYMKNSTNAPFATPAISVPATLPRMMYVSAQRGPLHGGRSTIGRLTMGRSTGGRSMGISQLFFILTYAQY